LPPLSSLLDDTIDQAIRKRQRRVLVIDSADRNLAALQVVDTDLDQIVRGFSLYGKDAAHQLDARIDGLKGAAQEAAIFLRIALAIQTGDAASSTLANQFAEQFAEQSGVIRAIADAYRFYPVPVGPFGDNSAHIVDLFKRSQSASSTRMLALELAGKRDVKQLRPDIEALLDDNVHMPLAHYALACMGVADERTKAFVLSALRSDAKQFRQLALGCAAADPRLIADAALYDAIAAKPNDSDAAWAILAVRDPRKLFEYAQSRTDLSESLMLRVVALTGYMDGIVAVCAAIAASDKPVTPAQADVLHLALGSVPVAARAKPNQPEEKSKAMRELILRVCRAAHIPVCNDADIGPWDVDAILVQPERTAAVRLRGGKALSDAVPSFHQSAFLVTHALRDWLYIERATAGKHALALTASDVARRQELAMMVGEMVDDIRTN
jgi:tellurite resistance protein